MKLPEQLFLLLLCNIVLYQLDLSNGEPFFYTYSCPSSTTGEYDTSSTYHSNLRALMSSISNDTTVTYGFYNFSSGQDPDRVNAIALCRGDQTVQNCRSCLNDATVMILDTCPNKKEAIGWNPNCMIRYSNRSMFGVMEDDRWDYYKNQENASNASEFKHELNTLLNSIKSEAASGNSLRKYSTGNSTPMSDFKTIYAMSQCTPDLWEQMCINCLDTLIGWIPECCDPRMGARVVTASCNLRYEKYRFYGNPAPLPSLSLSPPPPASTFPPTSLPQGKKNKNNTKIVIIARKFGKKLEIADEIISPESLQFDFATIRAVTYNFSDAKKIGQGGFGAVYKGTLPNSQDIAIKRLSANSGQGDLEFKNEVLLVAKLQHRNLVKLLGFCLEGKERLLIYEFVPNASLDCILFDLDKRRLLNWESRYKIIGVIARGLLYLHEDSRLRIIHRDLKASNVLIDEDMTPKIADFGMARLFVVDQTQDSTSRIVGTYGYMALEYARRGHFSVKSDIFSFGVLILEIISGQKNSDFRNGEKTEDLLSYAWKNWREGTWSNVKDPSLTDGSRNEMMRCMHIGLLCVQENEADRPTMASVVLMLNTYSLTLPVPSQPGFFAGAQQL